MYPRVLGLLIMVMLFLTSSGQDKSPVKFGKITPADFTVAIPSFDSGAHAVILADIGTSKVLPNTKGGFGYAFERKMRVYIADMNGVDAGKFEFPLFISRTGSNREELDLLKGYSYNLEGGKVVETKLESNQVFTEKYSKYRQEKKFSMPQLKTGTIFELHYRINSDFLFEFRPWEFQGSYPCLWSEYNVEVPEYFDFVFLKQGYIPMHIEKADQVGRSFMIRNNSSASAGASSSFQINGMVMQKRWVIKDVPSMKEESYTTTIDNHRSKIEFQLSAIRFPNEAVQPIMENWAKVTEDLMKHENFGLQVDKNNNWLDEIIEPILKNTTDPLEKAKLLYYYVRDNYNCSVNSGMYTSTGLKTLVKTKTGNVADLNLLLLALLRHENIESYPIILSTRSHGMTNELYPLMDRFNYTACGVLIGEQDYILDASVPELGFNKMPIRCYNGHARVLTNQTVPIHLNPDSLQERKLTMVIMNSEKGKLRGSVQSNPGYYQSMYERASIRESGEKALLDKIKKGFGNDFEVMNLHIDSLKLLEEPLKISYDFTIAAEDQDLVYISPVLGEAYKENPFKSANRHYPVEMPYRMDEHYIFTMNIPEDYTVDELPKSAKVSLNDNDGSFEYLISADASLIQMRCRIKLNKAVFQPDEYESLREFFSYVVKKQSEQIVLKKK